MEHKVFALFAGATAGFLAITLATAASAQTRLCVMAKQWVQSNCAAAPTRYGKEGSSERCAKARAWVHNRCTATAKGPSPKVVSHPRAHVLIRAARVPYARGPQPKWHGWEVSCCGTSLYLHGRRYRGGSPYGERAMHNNFEGGFHPTVFFNQNERFGLASQ